MVVNCCGRPNRGLANSAVPDEMAYQGMRNTKDPDQILIEVNRSNSQKHTLIWISTVC